MGGARDGNAVQLMKTSHRGSSSGKTQQEEKLKESTSVSVCISGQKAYNTDQGYSLSLGGNAITRHLQQLMTMHILSFDWLTLLANQCPSRKYVICLPCLCSVWLV